MKDCPVRVPPRHSSCLCFGYPFGTQGGRGGLCRNLGHLLTQPGPRALSPMEAEGLLWRDTGVLRRSRNSVGTPQAREGAWAPREPPGNSPAVATAAPIASPGSCHGPWSSSPGPRFAAVESLLQTPRTGGHQHLHGEWGSSYRGTRLQRSQSLLGWLSRDFREWKPLGPSFPPWVRVGEFEP